MKKIGRYIGDANYLNEKSSVGFFPYELQQFPRLFFVIVEPFHWIEKPTVNDLIRLKVQTVFVKAGPTRPQDLSRAPCGPSVHGLKTFEGQNPCYKATDDLSIITPEWLC